MQEDDGLAADFDACRVHLRGVAYRMLGTLAEADDAVQQAWLRAARADRHDVTNLPGWLTTITARVCMDMLRARRRRREQPLPDVGDPTAATPAAGAGPDDEAVLAESVGLALLVVLDRLSPAQRVAFVLHDLFAVPFEEIAPILDRSPAAAKKLASRARRRVRGASPDAAPDAADRQALVEAFLAAARGGDLGALLDLLAPDVVRRADRSAVPDPAAAELRGARAVAQRSMIGAQAGSAELALVDGEPGIIVAPLGRLFAVLRMTTAGHRITEIEVIADRTRLRTISLAVPEPRT